MSENDDLKHELAQLSARLAAIERLLHMNTLAATEHSAAKSVAPPAAPAPTIVAPPMPAISPIPPIAPVGGFVAAAAPAAPAHAAPPQDKSAALRRVAQAPPASPSDAVMERPAGSTSWELLIGGKATAWIGAIAVVLGAAFAIAVAVQRGWWGSLPPAARCVGIALAGAALLACGEMALRRIGRAASAGLFGAALGTLYLDAFATFRYFDLLEVQWAFVLMAAVAVIGFAVTYRTRFLSIGVLSIVGGYITPILLRGQSGHDLELLGYLTMLLGISLGLSAMVPRSFRPLRYVALGAHAWLTLAWLTSNSAQATLAVVFMSMWWVMTLIESVHAALRRQSADGNVVAVLVITMLYVTGVCWTLNSNTATGAEWLGPFTLMIGLLSWAIALQFGPGLDGLRNRPVAPMDRLAVALWAQGGVLLATAVGLQFKGFGQSVGWLAIAIAAVEVGRRLPARGVTIYGLVVGALALARVWIFDWWPAPMHLLVWSMDDVKIYRWSILALDALMVTHLAGQRIRFPAEPAQPRAPIVLAALGKIQWMILTTVCCANLSLTGAWLFGVLFLLALEPWGRRQRYFEIALLALTATAGRWLTIDAFAARMNPDWTPADALPVLNWQMGMALAIAATGWWSYRILRQRQKTEAGAGWMSMESGSAGWQWILALGTIFGLVAMSFEVDRAVMRFARGSTAEWGAIAHMRQLLFTLLWAIGAAGIGLMVRAARRGFGAATARAPELLASFAVAILGLCVLKWIFVDTLLFWLRGGRTEAIGTLPLANVQMLVGLGLAACTIMIGGVAWGGSTDEPAKGSEESFFSLPLQRADALVPVASCLMILWGLTFEVDRALGRIAEPWPQWLAAWPDLQLRGLLWTALWAAGGMAMMLLGKVRRMNVLLTAGWFLLLGTALAWLTYDTVVFRLEREITPVRVVFNLQFGVGALVAALLAVAFRMLRSGIAAAGEFRRQELRQACSVCLGFIALIGFVLGSFEINRRFTPDWSGVQTGLSVFWGLYGVMLVLIGFTRRASPARYAGLGLLGVTFFKALVFDMKNVDLVWRALTFVVVGLLFIGVSVVYAKLAPRMFGDRGEAGPRPYRRRG